MGAVVSVMSGFLIRRRKRRRRAGCARAHARVHARGGPAAATVPGRVPRRGRSASAARLR
ncbi:hypothetical protein [Brevundimonas sp.]|uniref:hypothetical protein n=1 Tax=Brevundimonas TaxID=41275 RepID=UPI00338EDB91